jgi:hypothetical protein
MPRLGGDEPGSSSHSQDQSQAGATHAIVQDSFDPFWGFQETHGWGSENLWGTGYPNS